MPIWHFPISIQSIKRLLKNISKGNSNWLSSQQCGFQFRKSVYMTAITKTDGQRAKMWHHTDNGLNASGSCGAERNYARLCGS